jgi:cytochrome b
MISIPIAAHILTGSILSLALPLGALIIVAIWYVVLWRRGEGER